MSKKGFIYKYTYPNGKVYIGQTRVSVKERHYQHMLAARTHSKWTLCEVAIAKHGEPQLEIVETIEVEDKEDVKLTWLLDKAEKKWIKKCESTTDKNGYNVQEGGKMLTPAELLLQERWYEIFEKDRWHESIENVKQLLESIGTKLCITKEKLTKEERSIWYGYKFQEFFWGEEGGETTFSSFYKKCLKEGIYCDIGYVPYEVFEILNDDNATKEEKDKAEAKQSKCYFDAIMKAAVEEHWIEDIRQTIWKQVMKEKDQIIRKYL